METQEKENRIRTLTKLEIRIVFYLCQGMESRNLATRGDLGFENLGGKSIERYLTLIYKKLGIEGKKDKEDRLKLEYCHSIKALVPDIETVNRWIPSPVEEKPFPAPDIFQPKNKAASSVPNQGIEESTLSSEVFQSESEAVSAVPNLHQEKTIPSQDVPHTHRSLEERVRNLARNPLNQWIAGIGVIIFISVGAFYLGRQTAPVSPLPTSAIAVNSTATLVSQAEGTVANFTSITPPTLTSTTIPIVASTLDPTLTPTITQTSPPYTLAKRLKPTALDTPTRTVTFTFTPPPPATVLFSDDFEHGISEAWNFFGVSPPTAQGTLVSTVSTLLLVDHTLWENIQINVDIYMTAHTGAYLEQRYLIIARYFDPDNFVALGFDGDTNVWMEKENGEFKAIPYTYVDGPEIHRWSRVLITINGDEYSASIGGESLNKYTRPNNTPGEAGLIVKNKVYFDNFIISSLP